jgi:hypothetical protein
MLWIRLQANTEIHVQDPQRIVMGNGDDDEGKTFVEEIRRDSERDT